MKVTKLEKQQRINKILNIAALAMAIAAIIINLWIM